MTYYVFKNNELLVKEGKDHSVTLPTEEIREIKLTDEEPFELTNHKGRFLIDTGDKGPIIEGYTYKNFRETARQLSSLDREGAIEAKAIMDWDRTHQYCGVCGRKLEKMTQDKSKVCKCGHRLFPELAAAIIVGIRKDNSILLAHNAGFPKGRYSIIAGFVELGEDLENAVRREVKEEIDIEIKNIQFFGSQSWPYPNTLMLGFVADYASGTVTPDEEEIMDADWYPFDELPSTPSEDSISGQIIRQLTKTDGHL